MLIGFLLNIIKVLKSCLVVSMSRNSTWCKLFWFSFSVFLFVLHLICPENEMLMKGDYLYEAFLLW